MNSGLSSSTSRASRTSSMISSTFLAIRPYLKWAKHWQRLCGCMILRSSWICKKECKCKMDWMIVIIVVWGPVTIYVLLFCRWSFGATTDGWTANASWASLESYWRSWTSAQWWLAGTSSSLPPPWWTQRWRRSSATPPRCPWRAPLGPAVSDPKTRAKI